ILCDMIMPKIDGYDVLAKLRENPVTATIPFIFLTGKSSRSDFRQGMNLGADDYLTKPFTRTELLNAIKSRLKKQATLKKYLLHQLGTEDFSHDINGMENILRHTLKKGELQQFYVQYQPIVDIHSGKIIGAESLLRWQNPQLGLISPSELIPLAESTGLIIPIGEWVLQTVCKQIKIWRDAGCNLLPIAVNLSSCQSTQIDFNQKIFGFLNANSLPPSCLQLELTESMILKDVNSAIATMNELRTFGIKIAIDDFGTGYSSLIYLKKLPIHTLKIDRYFIQNIGEDYQKSVITKALIQMGHNLNLNVIAEGVETEAELSFLRKHNCDAMQGFLFSRPLPISKFEKLLFADKTRLKSHYILPN
ncbi:MAG: EAL domain-containing response regulator, partial [Tolypothrix sp. Co-bin9]|nr:EAL domain-containing response regulator [Tolypothrix sp. Co-bin9]